jgi:AraC-like DNA-binding protein
MDKMDNVYKYPDISRINLSLICGAETRCDKNWNSGSKMAYDEFNRLYCVLAGQGMIQGDGGRIILEPGYIYLIPGQYKFLYGCPESMRLLWVHFQLEFLPGMDIFQRCRTEFSHSACRADTENFKYLISLFHNSSPRKSVEQHAVVLKLLQPFIPDELEKIYPAPENVEVLKPALEFLNKNFTRTFSLRETAKAVKLNPAYMSDIFRRTFGISPSRYLMNLRLRNAQNLLLTTDRRVSDIAAECGFDDPLYFSRVFRKKYHLSPRQFRQNRSI